ncbi:MAG: DUF418 domain-containing protein [Erythrobacter sp.]|nr:MAG: DUF418 domain-containing protein [Erythrobacter sp.]
MVEERIELVDGLRGYALLGLFLVHCVERFELYWLNPQPDAWFDAVFAISSGKAFSIFALLFGFGFATIMANARARGEDFAWRFGWRLMLLFVIGTVHALIYRGDILQVLALVGMVMIPFERLRSDRALLVIAALLFFQFPLLLRAWLAAQGVAWAAAPPLFWGDSGLAVLASGSLAEVLAVNAGPGMFGKWSFYVETGRMLAIAGLFLVGMVLHRQRLFADAAKRRSHWLAILFGGLGIWALARIAESLILPWDGAQMTGESLTTSLAQYRAIGATAFQVALFVLLWQTPVRGLLALLVPAGRMTLTLYVGQSLVFVPIIYGFGWALWDQLSNAELVLLGLLAFAAQIALAAPWFRHFRYGPLEWLWRVGTRTTLAIPIRLGSAKTPA